MAESRRLLTEPVFEGGLDFVYIGEEGAIGAEGGEAIVDGDFVVDDVGLGDFFGHAGEGFDLLGGEVGDDGFVELLVKIGDLGEQAGAEEFVLEGLGEAVLALDAGEVAAGLDGADVFGGEGAIEGLFASGEGDVALGGDGLGEGDFDAADGVDHGADLVKLEGEVVVVFIISRVGEVVVEGLGDKFGGFGDAMFVFAGGGLFAVVVGEAEGALVDVEVREGGGVEEEVAGEGGGGDLLVVVVDFDEADGISAKGWIAHGEVGAGEEDAEGAGLPAGCGWGGGLGDLLLGANDWSDRLNGGDLDGHWLGEGAGIEAASEEAAEDEEGGKEDDDDDLEGFGHGQTPLGGCKG